MLRKNNENTNERVQWYVEGKSGDNSPWIIPLSHDDFLIGRLTTCDLILSSSSVSRNHANLKILDEELYLTDLDSKNGTYRNGVVIEQRTLLRSGDLLKIGNSEFKVFTKTIVPEKEITNTIIEYNQPKELTFSEHFNLSIRESEVLFFLIKGLSLQVIGERLFISTGTVKNHVLKIYKKTDCHSRIELSTKCSEFDQ